jgi:hypothetical protein
VTILAKRRGDVTFWHTISVRFNCVIDDFMMLNQVRETAAADAAIELAINTLRKAFAQ